jgi:nitrate reductase gamma subunit
MRQIYELAVGPLAWAAFAVFILGSAWRLYSMYQLAKKKDGPFLTYMSWKFSLRSIAHWLTPFGSLGWRENAGVTIATFIFHLCLIGLPILALGHVVLWDRYHGIAYWSLPEGVADIMTLAVMACCLYFAYRRLANATVRYVGSVQDFVVLTLAFAPFCTGFLAYHQIGPPLVMTTLHILSGELMLMAIPFTRLSHMIFGLFARAYVGSEFGGVRHVKDW